MHAYIRMYVCMYVRMYIHTVRRKCLTGENFDKFDKSKLHRYNILQFNKIRNLSASTCNINGLRESVYVY